MKFPCLIGEREGGREIKREREGGREGYAINIHTKYIIPGCDEDCIDDGMRTAGKSNESSKIESWI